ncbi:MAG: hypothetical protein WD472_05795 [Dehalococcoidia bacterium]
MSTLTLVFLIGADAGQATQPAGSPEPATPTIPCPAGTATPPGESCLPCPTAASFGIQSTCPPLGHVILWGDDNCSGEADPIDSLLTLRHDVGLSVNTGDCPDMGEVVEVADASPHPWGDVDCSGEVNPIDSLKFLRFDAGLAVPQDPDCPDIGALTQVF